MGNSMDKILPGLYVGNIRGATNKKGLDSNQITHILSIYDRAEPVVQDRVYLCIKANDVASQDLTQYFSQCNDFIHNARINKGTVLVHCVAGMSRSVTVTTAYIMTITNLDWRGALNAVRGARRCANPNFGFQRQLLGFYHDHLHREKERLHGIFPATPFPDQSECERLIEVHRNWVLHGDEGQERDESETTYPLQHNAYNSKSESTLSTLNRDKTKPGPKICSLCSNVFDNQGNVSENSNTHRDDEILCKKCIQAEQETISLMQSAPDVARLDQPSETGPIAAQAGASNLTTGSDRPMETESHDELIDTMFTKNSRKKAKEVSFNEDIQISKVENIDSKMLKNAETSASPIVNRSDTTTHNSVTMTSELRIENSTDTVEKRHPDQIVEEMFNSTNNTMNKPL